VRFVRRCHILGRLGWAILAARALRRRCPIFVGFYITNLCNLRCKYCFVNVEDRFDDPARAGFSGDDVVAKIDELYAMGTRWIFLLGGEPLAHPEIGRITRHITGKNMLLHILTNGTMIEHRIDDIQCADGVCVSIDGGEAATDAMRGDGVFRRAMEGVEVALSRGMTTRIHAVLSKHNLGDLELLAEMAKDMGVKITVSPPNHLGAAEDPSLQLTRDDYRDFYERYRRLKEDGYPIANSFFSIDKALKWPVEYHEFIKEGQVFDDYKPIRCVIGDLHGCVDAEGTMFNCIQLGCLHGLNINEVGLRNAWNELPRKRPHCVSCASINTIETAAYLTLRPEIVMDGLRFFFGRRRR
jgi:MoaA/NifB/PqqE/SkfB family radical SAM enzyme